MDDDWWSMDGLLMYVDEGMDGWWWMNDDE